jgi:hypothetical protein
MMHHDALRALFADPSASRDKLISSIEGFSAPEPTHGSSFFIHLSELCPVACEHCMYSSDLSPKSVQDSLSKDDLDVAISYIDDSRSEKLNITGGGEPFLKFAHILRLVEAVRVPVVEIVTAGYWAKTEQRAQSVLHQLAQARRRNPSIVELRLRLSLDRYHVEAPRPVPLSYYANVARAWASAPDGLGLGYRSIQPDRGNLDRRLADSLGGRIEVADDWNHRLVMPDGRTIPITFNVMRFSGKASDLAEDEELRGRTKDIREYYKPFETGPGRLNLATAVNDAIRGTYAASTGAAITLNSDGLLWIFCGTSPDRKLMLGQTTFQSSMRHFFRDPITRFLVEDGVWALADLVAVLDPPVHAAALHKNDMAFLVEDLLASEDVRLAVTLCVTRRMRDRGALRIGGGTLRPDLLGMSEPELLTLSHALIAERRVPAC